MASPEPKDVEVKGPGGWSFSFTGPEAVGALGLVSIIVGFVLMAMIDDVADWAIWVLLGIGGLLLIAAVIMRLAGVGTTPSEATNEDPDESEAT